MSRTRRFFDPDESHSHRGPSDEMLAVDAASELRSLTLLYERYADRLYRYFLLCTGDSSAASRLMRELIYRLPDDLQRFGGQDRSFAGWLFSRASEVFWREFSLYSRVYRRASRYLPSRSRQEDGASESYSYDPAPVEFDEIAGALRRMPADQREVLGIHLGAGLRTAPAAEALRLPASLMSSHIQRALESLGDQLDVNSIRRLSEDVADLINSQSLSSEQRSNHFALIHGLFYGEVELETDEEQDRAPVVEIGALVGVVLVGLLGIWIWGLLTPGDPQDRELERTQSAAEQPAVPEPTETPTAALEPTPETDLDATPAVPESEYMSGTCLAADGKAQFDRFVTYFNSADLAAIFQMLPGEGYFASESSERSDSLAGMDQFFVHGDVTLASRYDVTSYLRKRYSEGERWEVLEAYPAEHYRNWQEAAPLEMYQDWKRENPGLSMIIVAGLDWSGDGQAPAIARGRVVVDCEAEIVIGWDIQEYGPSGAEQVGLADYMAGMEPLEAGEFRQVSALVQTDSRPDGGMLTGWEFIWREAITDAGVRVERIEVLTLDGVEAVSYRHSGNRWRLNQRGWIVYGAASEPPFPTEVELALPWLRQLPGLINSHDVDPSEVQTTTLIEDYTFTAGGATERFLEIDIENGHLGSLRLRERTPNGERIRPEIRIRTIERTDDFDPGDFDVPLEPRFPDEVFTAAHYDVPVDALDQLEKLEMVIGSDQTSESYRISWGGVEIDLTVRPSRGGLDPESIPAGVDESWTSAVTEYRFGSLVWMHRQFSGYPTDAVWDDGRYRFEISVDRESMSSDVDWNLRELIALADALSVSPEVDDRRLVSSVGDGVFARNAAAPR